MHFVRSPLILEEEIKCVWGIWNINVLLDGVNEALWLLPVDRSLHLMGCGLSFASSPYVNQYCFTVKKIPLTFDFFFEPTLTSILPSHIVTILTYLLCMVTLLTYLLCIVTLLTYLLCMVTLLAYLLCRPTS